MRIVFWNILHGGGTQRTPEIVLALLGWTPDVVILCEYRTTLGGQIRGVLGDHGLEHQVCTDPPEGKNGLLVASRPAIRTLPEVGAGGGPRWVGVRLPDCDLVTLAAHVPPLEAQDGEAQAVWQSLLRSARVHAADPTLVIGDLNAGRRWQDESGVSGSRRLSREHSALRRVGTESMGRLWLMGYRDAWRERGEVHREHGDERASDREEGALALESGDIPARSREFSWFSHEGRGVRIDHALASAGLLPRVRRAWYEHAVRGSGASDHAAIVVDIS